jgi:hypothetical protein
MRAEGGKRRWQTHLCPRDGLREDHMKWASAAAQGNCTNKPIGSGWATLPALSPFTNYS